MNQRPTNSDDVIDSRQIIEAIEELEAENLPTVNLETGETVPNPETTDEGLEELAVLRALASDAGDYSADWEYGSTLIRDSFFEDYARELADDIGAVSTDHGWPNSYIDWEAAADALKQDYTSVDFDGVKYWIR